METVLYFGLFVHLFDGHPIPSEAARMHVRLLFVKPGLERGQVAKILELQDRLCRFGGNLRGSTYVYDLEPRHELHLHYLYDFEKKKDLLTSAELRRGKKLIAVVKRKTVPKKDVKEVDIDLIKKAIRKLQEGKQKKEESSIPSRTIPSAADFKSGATTVIANSRINFAIISF